MIGAPRPTGGGTRIDGRGDIAAVTPAADGPVAGRVVPRPTPDPDADGAPSRAGPRRATADGDLHRPTGDQVGAPADDFATAPNVPRRTPGPEVATAPTRSGVGMARINVTAAIAQPVADQLLAPEAEPGIRAMTARVRLAGRRAKDHQPGIEGAATAQGASAPDRQNDVNSQAAGDQVEEMGRKEPGPFDPAAFKRDVKAAVEAMAPPANLQEADEFKESGQAGQAATAIHGIVTGGRVDSERDIEVATVAEPDPSGKEPKPVSTMVNDAPGPPLPDVDAAAALPGRRPPQQTDLSAGPRQVDAEMAAGNLTKTQLADANEPEFSSVLDARQQVREHAETDPIAYRSHEQLLLTTAHAQVEGVAATELAGMRGSRITTLGGVLGAKNAAKLADEQLRATASNSILDIHQRTQADVTRLLGTLDVAVDAIFTAGEKAARNHFEQHVDQKMRAYKADRYGGALGGAYWLKDKAFDLPDEVNDFYRDGRADYVEAMDGVIDAVASVVGLLLAAAQLRIMAGRDEVRGFVAGLPMSVRALGERVAGDLDSRFDQLSSDVDAKRGEMVEAVARRYVESRNDLDTRITELQEANKGFVSKAIDAVVGVAKTIYELGRLLLRVLLKAASTIDDILAHPIRFLGNLIGAVKGGLDRFVSRIGAHLQQSLLDLLLGELGGAGITMPRQLDFQGILDLVLQVLGLTYRSIRERVVKRFGEPVVAGMEQTVDIFRTLVSRGVGGLWIWIKEKLTDLEDLVVGKISRYITERVIKAGIGYVLALLNPAAAFIKACQGIYQIVMFVVERARQLAEFVEAILDSITAIAQGRVSAAVENIEGALVGGLRLAIAFLARLANLGAISKVVRSTIAAVRKPMTSVVDRIIFGAAEASRRTVRSRTAAAPVNRRLADSASLPRADNEAARPVRVAQDLVEVGPDERHVVFAQLAATGQIDIGIKSTPQLVTDLVGHYGPRIDMLPVTAPARLPKGGRLGEQPRMQARAALNRILRRAGALELDFERDHDARRAMHRTASMAGAASVYRPDPALTSRLASLGADVELLLRMFYAYDKPRFARAEDEPARGQKLTARVSVMHVGGGTVLPADDGRLRGIHPTRPGGSGFEFLAPDPHLAAPTRGAVRPGAEPARGIVHTDVQGMPTPGAGQPAVIREVVVRSWAVGGKPHRGSNASHTETQFFHWLGSQGADFNARITAVELRSVLSPCGDCTALLAGIATMLRHRPRGAPSVALIVFWDKVYGNDEGAVGPAASTFQRHVVGLGDSGWIVHGPTPPA